MEFIVNSRRKCLLPDHFGLFMLYYINKWAAEKYLFILTLNLSQML